MWGGRIGLSMPPRDIENQDEKIRNLGRDFILPKKY